MAGQKSVGRSARVLVLHSTKGSGSDKLIAVAEPFPARDSERRVFDTVQN